MLEKNRQDFNQRATITRSAIARAEENHKQDNAETIQMHTTLLEGNMATFNQKKTEILNTVDQKVQQQENRLQRTYDNVTRQVVKAKTEIEIHCATELATLELTLKENVEHLDATVGNSINSKNHGALIDKKLTVAISEL